MGKCLRLQKQFISNERLKNYSNYKEYLENLKLSKDFYIPLSIVEISFRNSLNNFFINIIGSDWLFRTDILQLDAQKDKSINRHFIFTKLNHIRLFRNKVFHHDKIISKQEYQNMMNEIYEVLSYFDDKVVNITKDLNATK